MAWQVLAGALAATLVAWIAIAAVAWLGHTRVQTAPIRWFGAAALAVLAVDVAGAPVPWALPPALLALGFAGGIVAGVREPG